MSFFDKQQRKSLGILVALFSSSAAAAAILFADLETAAVDAVDGAGDGVGVVDFELEEPDCELALGLGLGLALAPPTFNAGNSPTGIDEKKK